MKKLILFLVIMNANIYSSSLGTLQPVSGSPFTVFTFGDNIFSLAFSPIVSGNLFLAAADNANHNVSVFFIDQVTGKPTAATGSPTSITNTSSLALSPLISNNLFLGVTQSSSNQVSMFLVNQLTGGLTFLNSSATGSHPLGIAFSPAIGTTLFLAIANSNDTKVSVFSVNTSTGALTPVAGSPFTSPISPIEVAFSPLVSGGLFAAVLNVPSNNISVYSVDTSTGVFTQITGSPFATGSTHSSNIAFSPIVSGNVYLGVSNTTDNSIAIFSMNQSTGFLTSVPNSPFATGASTGPFNLAFSPLILNRLYLGAAENTAGSAASFSVNATNGNLTAINTASATPNPQSFAFSPAFRNLFAASAGNINSSLYIYNVVSGMPPTCPCT